jgi:serine O-acetyltransferase
MQRRVAESDGTAPTTAPDPSEERPALRSRYSLDAGCATFQQEVFDMDEGFFVLDGHGDVTVATSPPSPRERDLWCTIKRSALEAAAREPSLGRQLVKTVLMPATPPAIIGAVLAQRLASDRDDVATLRGLVAETLVDDPAVLPSIEADLEAVSARDPACPSPLHALLHFKGFHALQAHRVAHSLWRRGRQDAAAWLANRTALALQVDIHPAVPFGRRVVIDHATGIVIGETALVEDDVTIFHGVTLGATGKQRGDRHPKVRCGALLGAGAKLLGNLEVGRGSRVAAGSVVLASVPAHCTVAGIPARVVRRHVAKVAA